MSFVPGSDFVQYRGPFDQSSENYRSRERISPYRSTDSVDKVANKVLMQDYAEEHLQEFRSFQNTPESFIDDSLKISTPLHLACSMGDARELKMLFSNQAGKLDVNVKDQNNLTPIQIALKIGDKECVKLLIENGAKVNVVDSEKFTPLHYASQYGWFKLVKFFKDSGLNINAKTEDGQTPLMLASSNAHEDCTEFLIDNGANIDVHDNESRFSPFHYACEYGWFEVVKSLKEKGVNLNDEVTDGVTPLLLAMHASDERCALFLIDNGADFSVSDHDGWTILHHACSRGWIELVKLLKLKGAKLDEENTEGITPLLLSISAENNECADFLINNGANTSVTDKEGWTSLHHACSKGWIDTVSLLKDKGVDLNAKNTDGFTPLTMSINNGYKECAKFLIDNGASLSSDENTKPIHYVCLHGWQDIMELCLNGADVINAQDEDGDTPLLLLIQNGYIDVAKFLIDRGAQVDLANNQGITPLHIACENGYEDIVSALIAKSALLDVSDNTKTTPLHISIQENHESCTRLLIENGAKLNDESNSSGNSHFSLLMRDLKTPYYRSLALKILPNANIKKSDSLGNSPLHYAIEHKDKEFVDHILSKLTPMDFLHRNIYFETPWTQSKDSARWISNLHNPYEIAMLNSDPKSTIEINGSLIDEVTLKYGALAEDFIGNLSLEYSVNTEHLKSGTEKIPEEIADCDLDRFIDIYDDLIGKPGASIIPQEYRDRNILDNLIDKITNRTAFSGTPTDDDELEQFYKPIESALTHVLQTLMSVEGEEGEKMKLETLRALLVDGGMCGGKIKTMTANLYYKICLKKSSDFETMVYSKLANFREYIINASIPRHPQNIHDTNLIMKSLGVELGIPGGEEAEKFEDPYAGHGVDIDRIRNGFFRQYTPYYIADAIRKELKQDADFREEFVDFVAESEIPISDEWDQSFNELIASHGKLSKDKEIKLCQEKIVKVLQILKPDEEIEWDSLNDEKDDIFIACQKLEVDIDVIFSILELFEIVN